MYAFRSRFNREVVIVFVHFGCKSTMSDVYDLDELTTGLLTIVVPTISTALVNLSSDEENSRTSGEISRKQMP